MSKTICTACKQSGLLKVPDNTPTLVCLNPELYTYPEMSPKTGVYINAEHITECKWLQNKEEGEMGREFTPSGIKRFLGKTYNLYDNTPRGKLEAKSLSKLLRRQFESVFVVEKANGFFIYYNPIVASKE